LSKTGFEFRAGEWDAPEAACFGPIASLAAAGRDGEGAKTRIDISTSAF